MCGAEGWRVCEEEAYDYTKEYDNYNEENDNHDYQEVGDNDTEVWWRDKP
jgi:hypothetical protein